MKFIIGSISWDQNYPPPKHFRSYNLNLKYKPNYFGHVNASLQQSECQFISAKFARGCAFGLPDFRIMPAFLVVFLGKTLFPWVNFSPRWEILWPPACQLAALRISSVTISDSRNAPLLRLSLSVETRKWKATIGGHDMHTLLLTARPARAAEHSVSILLAYNKLK